MPMPRAPADATVPSRVRNSHKNTFRTLERSLQAAGTDGYADTELPVCCFFGGIDTLGRPEQNGPKKMDLTNVGCNRQSIYRIIATFAICGCITCTYRRWQWTLALVWKLHSPPWPPAAVWSCFRLLSVTYSNRSGAYFYDFTCFEHMSIV